MARAMAAILNLRRCPEMVWISLQTTIVSGLQPNANGQTHFDVLKRGASSWSVAAAAYSHTVGEEIELCQVIVTIDQNSHVTVLRELPFQKADIDVPEVTQWSLVDL